MVETHLAFRRGRPSLLEALRSYARGLCRASGTLLLFGDEYPVLIRAVPVRVFNATRSSGYADIEARVDRANLLINRMIELFFRDGSLTSRRCAGWFFQVHIIETELHRTKHDIHALQQHMVMGAYLRNLVCRYAERTVLKSLRIGHREQVLLEPATLLRIAGQLIQIDAHIERFHVLRLQKSKTVLDKLVIQLEVLIVPVDALCADKRCAHIAKHDAHFHLALPNKREKEPHHLCVFGQISCGDLCPFNFPVHIQFDFTHVKRLFHQP